MKKTSWALLAIAVVSAAAIWWNVNRSHPLSVTLVAVQRGEVRETVSNTRAGTVNTCNRARMSPILGGQIASLPVSEGDSVEAGQILLELWNVDVKAQLQLAVKERDSAIARADESCSAASVSDREAQRFNRLYEQGLVSDEQVDNIRGEAQAREAACRATRNMVEVSDAKIALAEAHVEQSILRAPFSGIVAEINGEVGEIVTPSPVGVATVPAVDLIDPSCTFVTAPIDEVDAPGINAGMKARITLDAFPDQWFPATVTRVAPYVLDQEKQARTVDIEAEFDDSSRKLLPGYSADVEVTLTQREDTLFIPAQAISDDNEVFVINTDGIIEAVPIETGIRNWQVVEVLEGVTEAQSIVAAANQEGLAAGVPAVAADESSDQ